MEETGDMKRIPSAKICVLLCLLQQFFFSVANAGTTAFNYDPAGRLTTATFADGKSIAYAYDAAGSLSQRQMSVGISNPDSDGDGMADAWEQLYFGNLLRDGSGDFDNDGFNDLNEFLAGTLPNNAGSVLNVLLSPTNSGGGVTVEWVAVAGKTYRLQFKNALSDANWTNISGDVTATTTIADKMDATASAESHRFYRVMLVP
jgi:YD repeat-containing protein